MVNTNLLIGKLKNQLITIILEKSTRKRKNLNKQLLNEGKKNRSPIRPGRSFHRAKE